MTLRLPGQTGQSFNIYDRVAGKWHQTWVDSSGRMHTRFTFFRRPDGSVRQYSERTSDGGKTWQVNYDLIYTRRK